jgi:hypothetical protein
MADELLVGLSPSLARLLVHTTVYPRPQPYGFSFRWGFGLSNIEVHMHQTSCQRNPRFPDAQTPDLTSPRSPSSVTKINGSEQSQRSTAPDLLTRGADSWFPLKGLPLPRICCQLSSTDRGIAFRVFKVHKPLVTGIPDFPMTQTPIDGFLVGPSSMAPIFATCILKWTVLIPPGFRDFRCPVPLVLGNSDFPMCQTPMAP